MVRKIFLGLAVVLASVVCNAQQVEHHGIARTGTLSAPDIEGPSISVFEEAITATKTVTMYCPIYDFGKDDVGIFWKCHSGELNVFDSSVNEFIYKVPIMDGKMSMACAYPHLTVDIRSDDPICFYAFEGVTALDSPVTFVAKGNQYVGTVYWFDGVW